MNKTLKESSKKAIKKIQKMKTQDLCIQLKKNKDGIAAKAIRDIGSIADNVECTGKESKL